MSDLKVDYRAIDGLKPKTCNPRTHTGKQIRQIADSIRAFGFTNPVLIDQNNRIIAGHGRVQAAKLLDLQAVPTIRLKNLTEAQLRAYILADNKLAELAGWDRELLAMELGELSALDLDFDLEITGFETAEIDILIDGPARDGKPDPADEVPAIDASLAPVSRAGDLWLLGEHRLLCGNALEGACYEALMAGTPARLVFSDPPYNVRIAGHVGGLGRVKHREFAMAAGEMSEAEFIDFLATALGHLAAASIDGAVVYVCMDWRHVYELLTAGRKAALELLNLCVWNKDNGGMGSFYRSKHELVFVFKAGHGPHLNTIELGRHGRYRTNVWDYAGVNSLRPGRREELDMHPTVKPVALVADAIKDCSRRGEIVLDAFAGSGTTIIAAEKTGRKAYAIELDPRYVDTAVRRWQRHGGRAAIHAGTGRPFAEVEAERRPDDEAKDNTAEADHAG